MSTPQTPKFWRALASVLLVALVFCVGLSAQVTSSGTISGSVKDQTGAVVAKATVTLSDPSIGATRTIHTNGEGQFVATNMPRGTYTITVEAAGFQKLVKTNVFLSSGDNLSAGELSLKVGTTADAVTVTADTSQLQMQSESGERSDLISGKQLNDLGMNGRMVFDYVKVLPGIISTFNGAQSSKGGLDSFVINGARPTQHQLTIDGVTNVDNGCNCASQITINPDAIAEVRVLTSNYDAEYGKAAGGQMAIITKNGTNQFHGNARWFHRHEGLNAQNWFDGQANQLARANGATTDPQPKQKYRYNYAGYQIGGPVVLPWTDFNKGRDKLFFFFSEEFYQQLLPGGYDKTYVPTLAEINGDFSKSTDGHGNPITIIDPTTGQPFVGNIIPQNRINTAMQQVLLKVYPRPNAVDPASQNGVAWNGFNYITSNTTTHPRREDIARVDYQVNSDHRLSFTFINNAGHQSLPEGLSPQGISNFQFPNGMYLDEPGFNASAHLTSTLTNTLINDLTFGTTVNKQQIYSVGDTVNASKYNLNIPLLFPVSKDSPIPDFSFGGISNQTGTWSYLGSLPWKNADTVINLSDGLTWANGKHTYKAGVFVERNRKDQSSWGNPNGTFNFSGNDGQTASMGLQTGDPYANALLGNYTSFQQQNGRLRGLYRYTNIESYVQDSYKVTHRLTVNYGMRFAWIQPQHDANNQVSYFDPSAFDPSKAVRLYYRMPDGSGNAYDRLTGQVVNGALYGTIVPGSGDINNGMVSAKNGGLAGGFENRGVLFEPRLGFALDIMGDGKTVLRGGGGLMHDRFQGNPIYNLVVGNPPASRDPKFGPGTLAAIPTLASNNVVGPVNAIGFDKSGQVPRVVNYSLGLQRDLGWGMMLDVADVGGQSRHLSQKYNLNAIPYGTLFTAAAQDPAKYNPSHVVAPETWMPQQWKDAGFQYFGDNAYDSNFLRKYSGYADLEYWNWGGDANYNSLQVSLNKRFGKGLTFGASYTRSKAMTTSNSDGQWTNIINPKEYNYALASWDRPNVLAINYVYDLPKFSKWLGNSKAVSYITDGFQLSGISQFMSGPPHTVSGDFSWYGTQLLSGSWTEPANMRLVGDPNAPSSDPYSHVNPAAFALPTIGTPKPWAQQYVRSGGTNRSDISIFKNIPLGNEARYIQLRLEAFNAFNHPQFYGLNLGAQPGGGNIWGYAWNYATTAPVPNVRPVGKTGNIGQYFGEYNSSGDQRVVQLGMKLYF